MPTTRLHDEDLHAAFDRGAPSYDRLVALHPQYQGQLDRSAARLRLPEGGAGMHVLDLGCGTGASTAALLRAAPQARITAVDASAGMLEQARAKQWPPNVTFRHSTAEQLAETDVEGPFDAVFAAYLFRNVTKPDDVLASLWGLLRPGARLAVHDYMLSGASAHRAVWSGVCQGVVIPLGTVTGQRPLYRHLWRSVLEFDTADVFAGRLRQAGFGQVRVLPMPGWSTGIVHTVVASVPPVPPAPGALAARGTETDGVEERSHG